MTLELEIPLRRHRRRSGRLLTATTGDMPEGVYEMSRTARLALALLMVVFVLVGTSLFAQDAAAPKPISSVVVILLKSDDVGEKNIQQDVTATLTTRMKDLANAQVLDLKSALPATVKDDQIKRLMAFPELIARTDHVRRNLRADGVLVANIDMFGKAGKQYYMVTDMTFYDARSGTAREIDCGTVDYKSEADKQPFLISSVDEIVKQLQRTVPGMQNAVQPSPDKMVVCNKNSKLFHAADSHHLPGASTPQEQLTRAQAIAAGYQPCSVCYPESIKGVDPESLEAILGAETAGFIEYYYRKSNDPADHERLQRIGKKILDANHFTKRQYVFTALNSEEINAFAAPAGYIYATTGMLKAVESDDELACVLGHEIAHVEREHGVKQYKRAQNAALLGILASVLTGTDLSILSDFVRELVMRGYDRKFEAEADRYGYAYVNHTTYDPESDFTLLGKLKDMELASNWKIASWERTHPKADDRIKYVTDYKAAMQASRTYVTSLEQFDAGLASAVKSDEMRYVDSIDQLKFYVETVKTLP